MDERPVEVPEGFFERLRKDPRRLAAVAGLLLVALLIGGLGIWRFWPSSPPPVSESPTFTPSPTPDTTFSPAPSATPEPTPSAPATVPPVASEPTSPPPPRPRPRPRASLIAYRAGERVFVAAEDGDGATSLGTQPAGPLALSPDGTKLAIASSRQGLVLVDVATRRRTRVGTASPERPVWTPSSSAVLYVRGDGAGRRIRIVDRDGRSDRAYAVGSDPAVGPREGTAFAREGSDEGGRIVIRRGDRSREVTFQLPVEAVGATAGRVWAVTGSAVRGDGEAGSGVWWVDWSGGAPRRLTPLPRCDSPCEPSLLLPSPDGSRLLLGVVGDDGFSRLFVIDAGSGESRTLTPRRDGYPVDWTSDGSRVVFVEGNALQGEGTRLVSVRPDGSGKRVLLEGTAP